MKLCRVCVLLVLVGSCFAIDRNAFTFTHYNLNVRVEPEQQRLAVRGRITLRNDSASPQKVAVLQVSSSLDWRSIQVDGKPLQFVSQPYTSDSDHTGALSEAIATLPAAVAPKSSVDIDVGYEGVIPLDTTRLKRIGVPEDIAKRSDWDQISPAFTAVRGVGYVVWYPVAMDAANMAEGSSGYEILGTWKARHAEASMDVTFASTGGKVVFSGTPGLFAITPEQGDTAEYSVFSMTRFDINVPTFIVPKSVGSVAAGTASLNFLQDHQEAAKIYSQLITKIQGSAEGLGPRHGNPQIFDVPDPEIPPFATESMVLMPLTVPVKRESELGLVYALAWASDSFHRPWCITGLAHFAQAAYLEHQDGRRAAVKFMEQRLPVILDGEKARADAVNRAHSLIDCTDEEFCAAKAMYVWWMLGDMLGSKAIPAAEINYKADEDHNPSYVQHLLEQNGSESHRNLQWFFDDWVYHDRGLPDFRVAAVYASKTEKGIYLVTVTLENLGEAGAEVPFVVRFNGGEVWKRLVVRGKGQATTRVEVPASPTEVVVNDGSVPEADIANNTFQVQPSGAK